MSGPKVVRIVTREEILAICEGHLQRLAQALARWQAQAERIGELGGADLAATHVRHERLCQLLRDDQFANLQKEVPAEIEFLDHDLAQREERAVVKAAQKRRSQRNLRENAATLLRALQSRDGHTEPSLLKALRAMAAGNAMDDAEMILADGFSRLNHDRAAESLSETQRELAQALHLDEGAPVLRIERLTHDTAGRPIDFEYLYYRADAFQYRLRTQRKVTP